MTTRNAVRVIPLGGLGEIGMNCMAVQHGDRMIAIDCGVTFPERHLGLDVIHPRMDYLLDRERELDALIVTHGHEDHIGAVPYLLAERPVPVYGPPYALALLRDRWEEFGLPEPDLRPLHAGRSLGVGPFEIRPFAVHHSIPDALLLAIRTPAGIVVHSGDFKIEEEPITGAPFDLEGLQALGESGVRLLLSDSTNADVEGRSGDEVRVARALNHYVAKAENRLVVAIFASNVFRLGALLAAASEHGKRVLLLGRSVLTHTRVASELSILKDVDRLLVPPERAQAVPRSELLVIATGTQGETAAALSRLARRDNAHLTLEAGDEVLLSSRVIPGSERAIHAVIDGLERQGVTVHQRRNDPSIHVSGHACRTEQRMLIDALRPRSFMPVHGTYYHLRRHAALAREAGIADVHLAENGDVVEVDEERVTTVHRVETGRVHRQQRVAVDDELIAERSRMGGRGVAVVTIPLNRQGKAGRPTVILRGYTDGTDEDVLCDRLEGFVDEALRKRAGKNDPPQAIEDRAERAARRFFRGRETRSPYVIATAVVST